MSCMIVSYGEDNGESSINLLFGKTLLQLLEIEDLGAEELFQWCLVRGITIEDSFWEMKFDWRDLALVKFFICLRLSNQQLEHSIDVLNSDNEFRLLVADITYEWLNFDDVYDLRDTHPLKAAIIDLYMNNIFLKCQIVCSIKESLQKTRSRKIKGRQLQFRKSSMRNAGQSKQLSVDVPWRFPTIFAKKMTQKHTLKSQLHINFFKWTFKDYNIQCKDMDPSKAEPVKVSVDLKWQESKNRYQPWACENERSQISIALKQIQERQAERRKIFHNGELLSRSENNSLKLFEGRNKTRQIQSHQKNGDMNEVLNFDTEKQPKSTVCKENREINDLETKKSFALLSQLHDIEAGMNHELLTPAFNVDERSPLEYNMLSGWNRITFIPRLNDPTEADCVLKIKATCSKEDKGKNTDSIGIFLSKSDDEFTSVFPKTENVPSSLIDSKITLKKFIKTKYYQLKSDISYYRQVAKYCIEDLKKPSSDSVSF